MTPKFIRKNTLSDFKSEWCGKHYEIIWIKDAKQEAEEEDAEAADEGKYMV